MTSVPLTLTTPVDDPTEALRMATSWCALVDDMIANRQSTDDVFECTVEVTHVEQRLPSVVNHINPGSLNKAGEKFASTLMNRFQDDLVRCLGPDWSGELAPVAHHVDAMMRASRKAILKEVMARLGFDWGDDEYYEVFPNAE